MTIVFYNVSDEPITLVKTLTGGTTLTGTLRAPASVTDPVIIIEKNSFPTWNYAYVSEFNRYYFINNITSVNENLWMIDMHVDVLMSNNVAIRNCSAYVSRNQTALSIAYLPDTAYPVSMLYTYAESTPTLVSGGWYTGDPLSDTNPRFVVQIQGTAKDVNDAEITYKFSVPALKLYASGFHTLSKKINSAVSVFGSKTVADCIIDAYALPVIPHTQSHLNGTISLPQWTSETLIIAADTLIDEMYSETIWSFSITDAATDNYNQYKRFAPYNKYFLRFLPFGQLELDPSFFNFTTDKVYLRARVNVFSGDCVLYYGKTSTDIKQYLASSSVKISLPFTSLAYDMTGALTGTIAGAASLLTGNYSGLIPAAGAMMNSFAPKIGSHEGKYQFIESPVLVTATAQQSDGAPSLFGRPVHDYGQLSGFYGYTEVDRVHLTGMSDCYDSELKEIESLLKSGVILPSP